VPSPTPAAAPTATPLPEPTPAWTPSPTAVPTAVVLLGSGPPVRAASRTLGDGTATIQPRREALETGQGLVLSITPGQARVFLDGRALGVASDWDDRSGGAALGFRKPGKYQLRFTYPGRRDLLVAVTSGGKGAPALVRLVEELPEGLRSAVPPGELPPPDLRTAGALRFDVQPPDALVSLDGRALGPASRWSDADLSVPSPGVHEVRLSAKGRETAVLRVVASPLVEGARATVTRALSPR
jgi:hypothetical protein